SGTPGRRQARPAPSGSSWRCRGSPGEWSYLPAPVHTLGRIGVVLRQAALLGRLEGVPVPGGEGGGELLEAPGAGAADVVPHQGAVLGPGGGLVPSLPLRQLRGVRLDAPEVLPALEG